MQEGSSTYGEVFKYAPVLAGVPDISKSVHYRWSKAFSDLQIKFSTVSGTMSCPRGESFEARKQLY